jgi:hypothetical protein
MNNKVQWLSYQFDVYLYNGSWNDVGGVYVFTGQNHLFQWVPLYVGEAGSFRTRMIAHEKWNPAVHLGATHVHAMVMELDLLRKKIEQELIQAYHPPLNVQHNWSRWA